MWEGCGVPSNNASRPRRPGLGACRSHPPRRSANLDPPPASAADGTLPERQLRVVYAFRRIDHDLVDPAVWAMCRLGAATYAVGSASGVRAGLPDRGALPVLTAGLPVLGSMFAFPADLGPG